MNAPDLHRTEQLLGQEGQKLIRACTVAVVGAGGVGGHVLQQLAYLRVAGLQIVEPGELKKTNRNRYVTADATDPIPGSDKVVLGKRLVERIDPTIKVTMVKAPFPSAGAYAALHDADVVFGCVDGDGPRQILTEFCAAFEKPYVDIATDVASTDPLSLGGRVCTMWHGPPCLVCLGELDHGDVQAYFASADLREDADAIYGVRKRALDESGPSVVSLNGVVASLAVTEFMFAITGLRAPASLIKYYAERRMTTTSADKPAGECYFCSGLRGKGDDAGLERYLT